MRGSGTLFLLAKVMPHTRRVPLGKALAAWHHLWRRHLRNQKVPMLKPLVTASLFLALCGAAAAGEADGAWNCDVDGTSVGSIGIDGNNYVFANPQGASGKGGLAYQRGADEPTILVLDGPLAVQGMLGGWLDASIPDDPNLRMVDAIGNQINCVPRR